MKRTVTIVGNLLLVTALVTFLTACGQGRGKGHRPGRERPVHSGSQAGKSADIQRLDGEKRILSVLADMFQNQRRGMFNVSPQDGRLLRLLTETTGARHVVEIGTSNGYSAIWICLGLKATGGRLTTHEIDPHRASLARENFKRAGVDQIVTLVEGNAHSSVTKLKGPIDLLFLDADKGGYIDYLTKLLPLVRPGGLMIAHNTTSHRSALGEYIDAVTTDPNMETIFLHKEGAGIGVTLKKR